jgi:hypothetical protein
MPVVVIADEFDLLQLWCDGALRHHGRRRSKSKFRDTEEDGGREQRKLREVHKRLLQKD